MCVTDIQNFDSEQVSGDSVVRFGTKYETQMTAITFFLQKMLNVFENGLVLLS